ncbi:universal stress protein [Halomarina litorea]|uniref:universal stress protein n=1 Tax=Halomarina litorea TaxID=2961595 RepID=UPI0020C3D53A|nr:universal stress protein [Halomarina sp. BCD28]
MVLLAPFDGSDLSRTAVARATRFGELTGEEVVVLVVVPPDAEFAEERGWLRGDEAFDAETVGERIADRAREVAPDATVRVEHTENTSSMASTTMDISRRIRQVAHELDVSIVFVGSENAGRVTSPVTSVGSPVSEDPHYDVHIVRHPD